MRKCPIVAVALWSCLAAAGCERAGGPPPADGAIAAPTRPARRVTATGRVEGWQEADVTSKLPGRVLSIDYEEGDEIEANAPVVHLEDGDLLTRVRKADARAAEAGLALKRMRALRADAIVSASEFDRAEATQRTLAAAADEARVMLGYATIKAPFRGTLMRKFKEVGEGVVTGSMPDPIFRIADLSRLKVIAEVPETDVGAVETAQPAEVTADAYPGERFPATVVRVGLAVGRKRLRSDNPRERLNEKVVEVELGLAADARLKSGLTVDVTFGQPGATRVSAPSLPSAASATTTR